MSTSNYQSLAYERLRSDIVHCRLVPGQKLSAKMLEESLGVGRTPIRESLVRLSELNLVYTVPQSGTFVSKISMRSAEGARFVREHLEQQVTVECSARMTTEQLADVRGLLEREEAAIYENDAELFFDLDNAFHEYLFTAVDRHEIWMWINAIDVDLERYRWLRTQVQTLEWETIMDQHRRIYRALVNHDTEDASYMASAHMRLMTTERDAVVDAFPDYFEDVPPRAPEGWD